MRALVSEEISEGPRGTVPKDFEPRYKDIVKGPRGMAPLMSHHAMPRISKGAKDEVSARIQQPEGA